MRKVLVTLKRVVDYNVRVRIKPDGSGMATEGLKMSINPFDEIALEEALRMRERGEAGEVLAVSIGGDECQQQLRTGLAMGADRALLVQCEGEVEPLAAAGILLEVIRREDPKSSSWASRRSTTTATRPARCWQPCGDGRRPRSLRKSN